MSVLVFASGIVVEVEVGLDVGGVKILGAGSLCVLNVLFGIGNCAVLIHFVSPFFEVVTVFFKGFVDFVELCG